tara:strand:+ start:866 stop:1225 length:360 start_codon:yes stop_codon:yes gene_type:complete
MSKLSNNGNANKMAFGQYGCSFTNTNTTLRPPAGHVIVAIQFLSNTTFDELSPVGGAASLSFGDDTLEVGNALSGGQVINAAADSDLTVFPEGMTIYGRWQSFTIDADATGGVIAYFGE